MPTAVSKWCGRAAEPSICHMRFWRVGSILGMLHAVLPQTGQKHHRLKPASRPPCKCAPSRTGARAVAGHVAKASRCHQPFKRNRKKRSRLRTQAGCLIYYEENLFPQITFRHSSATAQQQRQQARAYKQRKGRWLRNRNDKIGKVQSAVLSCESSNLKETDPGDITG